MKKRRILLFTFSLIFLGHIAKGQGIDFRITKIQVFGKGNDKNKISTWDFHKPNIITQIEVKNKSEDTLRFIFAPPNCAFSFILKNKIEKQYLNFAYNDFLENEVILPHDTKKLSLMWLINPILLTKTTKNDLIKNMSKSYVTIDYGLHKLVSLKTNNVIVKKPSK